MRRFPIIVSSLLTAAMLIACGDSSSEDPGGAVHGAGTSGTSGTGGTTAAAGSSGGSTAGGWGGASGTAGDAGASGVAGGAGGTGNGGAAGQDGAGAAGQSGVGAAGQGGAGAAGQSGAGASGKSGSAGAAGKSGGAGAAGKSGMGGTGGSPVQTCAPLTDIGSDIKPTFPGGPAPTPVGGVISDGTYVLTSVEAFEMAPIWNTHISMTVVIEGASWHVALGTTIRECTVAPSGAHLNMVIGCPTGLNPQFDGYSANGDELVLFRKGKDAIFRLMRLQQ